MPKLAALAISIVITLAVGIAFASLAVWSFGRVGRALLADSGTYQSYYERMVTWLDGRGISIAGLWAEHFNVRWLLRTTQYVTGRVNTALSFWLIALIYITLGLLEVDIIRRKIEALPNRDNARMILRRQVQKVYAGTDADECTDWRTRRSLCLGGGSAVCDGMGRGRVLAELHSFRRTVHRNAVSHIAGNDALR
jgi:predicted PurR-regulated permease PerM